MTFRGLAKLLGAKRWPAALGTAARSCHRADEKKPGALDGSPGLCPLPAYSGFTLRRSGAGSQRVPANFASACATASPFLNDGIAFADSAPQASVTASMS